MTAQEVPNIVHPYLGGQIEESRARTFTGQNRITGQPEEVNLQNRISITEGRRTVTLSGGMVKALAALYNGKDEFSKGFRAWCDLCK